MFKGLQRPLELMGLQGRYIYWAGAAAGGSIVGFIVMYIALGFVAGLITLVVFLIELHRSGRIFHNDQAAERSPLKKM